MRPPIYRLYGQQKTIKGLGHKRILLLIINMLRTWRNW
jgi:hypothetical protein